MKKARKVILTTFFILLGVIALLAAIGMRAQAAGLVDNTVDGNNLYSQYDLSQYELDFYVDSSWGWLPWNWKDGLGKSIMYGLNSVSNVLWILSTYFSSATGYVVQEAYNLDFIGTASNAVGTNIQALAGVSSQGVSSTGFYSGMLGIIILVVGVYSAYMGLYKRATSKVISAIVNVVVLFVVSGAFIAYAPTYISVLNDFSSDMSTEALNVGAKIVMPDSNVQGKDSTSLIRDNLFAIQIKQPWLLLQFGDSSIENIGEERAAALLSATGEERENVVKNEIENNNNGNLSVSKIGNRLGTVIFLLLFNLLISLFVFFLCGIMIFSQVLFIIYATILPISFLLGMIPNFSNTWQRAVLKVFNALLVRTGITLILTIAFSLSSMVYSLSVDLPFFFVAFMQIVIFIGIYLKLNEIMGMFSLQGDSQGMANHFGHKAKHLMHRGQHKLMGAVHGLGRQNKTGKGTGNTDKPKTQNYTSANTKTTGQSRPVGNKATVSERVGRTVGNALDMPGKIKDKAAQVKDNIASAPTNMRYAAYQTKEKAAQGVKNFAGAIDSTKSQNQAGRMEQRTAQRQTVAQRRAELEQQKRSKNPVEPVYPSQERQTEDVISNPDRRVTVADSQQNENLDIYNQEERQEDKPINSSETSNPDKRVPVQHDQSNSAVKSSVGTNSQERFSSASNEGNKKPSLNNQREKSVYSPDVSNPDRRSVVQSNQSNSEVKSSAGTNNQKRISSADRKSDKRVDYQNPKEENIKIPKSPIRNVMLPNLDSRKPAKSAKQRPSRNQIEPMASMQEIKDKAAKQQNLPIVPPKGKKP
ncbi:CD3337/EF1877 family mobilome membrane protein [Scatolibacter rhodanostii]|uniref:CD3337/EF1877 family mobilome membrane protein n=1 Tax=Scatolibacter rhodanostii TaxID=2014781 RepID=UPI000C08626C|nr:hypothetical protein [Scatolibacter rhodanostii]